jgi:hypothetical protein
MQLLEPPGLVFLGTAAPPLAARLGAGRNLRTGPRAPHDTLAHGMEQRIGTRWGKYLIKS